MSIDPDDIIRLGDDLMDRYPQTFTARFDENKRRVEQLTELQSRHVRNRLAGYITRNHPETDTTLPNNHNKST